MRRRLIGILSLLLSSFLFAVSASAVDLPQCKPGPFDSGPAAITEFVLITQDNIIFEPHEASQPKIINGNVLVTSVHIPAFVNSTTPRTGNFSNTGIGFVRIGSNTTITGTVIADVLFLPDAGAPGSISHCVANTIVGGNLTICGTVSPAGGFSAFATANPTCVGLDALAFSKFCGLPTPVVAQCANAAGPLTVAENGTLTLPPAPPPFPANTTCFGDLVLEKAAILTLGPPNAAWTFKSIHMKAGSRLIGAPGATVNVNGVFLTDGGAIITNIDLNIAFKTSAEVAQIFNNSILTNVLINAPFGKCHLHTGTDLAGCSEACCKILDVEPITAECPIPPENGVCACEPGFKFQDLPLVAVFDASPALTTARNCVKCLTGDTDPNCPAIKVCGDSRAPQCGGACPDATDRCVVVRSGACVCCPAGIVCD